MIRAFFYSRKWFWWAYGGALFLFALLYAQVYMSVLINEWYGGFYNLLQQALSFKANPGEGVVLFYDKLFSFAYVVNGFEGEMSFAVIAFPYVLLATITAYVTRRYTFWWREAITFDYIPRWRNVKEEIEGASQRIQEDAYRFARIVESLGLQVVRAAMTLIAFLPLLWSLSMLVEVPFIDGETITFVDTRHIISPSQIDGARFVCMSSCDGKEGPPLIQVTNNDYFAGILVWIALIASIGGMVISWFVGWFLPGLEYNNQRVEAAFRKELVLGEDDKERHALPQFLVEIFVGVRFNYKRLFLHYGYFDIWSNLYDQFMIIVPYLVIGPSLFTGAVLLGVVVQVSNAFQKVHGSFSLPINNWTTITELRSIWKRLHEFEANLDRYQIQHPPA